MRVHESQLNGTLNSSAEDAADQGAHRLKVLVMYEDLATRQRAKSLLGRLSAQFGTYVTLSQKLYRLDLLYLDSLREQAALEGASADVIVLSVSRKTTLSLADREWTTRWLDQKGDRPCLFCLLLGPEWDGRGSENTLMVEVENLISTRGVLFFCGTIETPFNGLESAVDSHQICLN